MKPSELQNSDLVQLDGEVWRRLEKLALATGSTVADLVHQACREFAAARTDRSPAGAQGETLYDAFEEAGLIGCLLDAPPDLSTNEAYFEGFGRD